MNARADNTLAEFVRYNNWANQQVLLEPAYRLGSTDRVCQEWQGKTIGYEALAVFIQIINYGIEHRTNITTILSNAGQPAPEPDGWGYLWSHTDRFDLK